jgi:glycine/D-amino acid oxidase-like deaminating enzyme
VAQTYDAIVVGGGVVGASAAYHLVRAGLRTLLVDRGDPGRATDAGAGIISPETNSRDPDRWHRFARAAAEYYPTLVARLREDGEADTGYARCGKLLGLGPYSGKVVADLVRGEPPPADLAPFALSRFPAGTRRG